MHARRSLGRSRARTSLIALAITWLWGCGSTSDAPEGEAPADDQKAVATPEARSAGGTAEVSATPEARSAGGTAEVSATFAGIPRVELGRSVVRSSLAGSPGYAPPSDADLEVVEQGRREVEPLEGVELKPEYRASAEALARRIIEYLNDGTWEGLYQNLMIGFEEYETICWPEFPSSRPITRISAAHAWDIHRRHGISGAQRGLNDVRTKTPLTFDRVEFTVGWKDYTNFNLLDGARIHATGNDGTPVELSFAETFIERNGRWKVYTYKD